MVDWSVIPLNEAGHYQWTTAWLAGIARVLEFPGLMIVKKLHVYVPNRPEVKPWCLMMAINVPIYLLATILTRLMWMADGGANRKLLTSRLGPARQGEAAPAGTGPGEPSKPRRPGSALAGGIFGGTPSGALLDSKTAGSAPISQSALPTRRQFLAAGNRVALAAAAASLAYSFGVERECFGITRLEIPIRGLPKSLHGLTIAQLTDIHHGPWTSLAFVRRIVEATNALNADLIALTGDYILYSNAYVRPVAAELTELRARIGVLGVMGNHDWFDAGPVTQSEFRRAGLRLIDNSRVYVSSDRRLCRGGAPRQGLCIAGLADLWGGRPDYSQALGGVPHDMPRVLLSHNPDTAELPVARDRRHRVDLMLSGHTHGGQINIPGLGSPFIPSSYGQKYAHGLIDGPSFPVFVSTGLGTNAIPLRFCCPPEIALITLVSE